MFLCACCQYDIWYLPRCPDIQAHTNSFSVIQKISSSANQTADMHDALGVYSAKLNCNCFVRLTILLTSVFLWTPTQIVTFYGAQEYLQIPSHRYKCIFHSQTRSLELRIWSDVWKRMFTVKVLSYYINFWVSLFIVWYRWWKQCQLILLSEACGYVNVAFLVDAACV